MNPSCGTVTPDCALGPFLVGPAPLFTLNLEGRARRGRDALFSIARLLCMNPSCGTVTPDCALGPFLVGPPPLFTLNLEGPARRGRDALFFIARLLCEEYLLPFFLPLFRLPRLLCESTLSRSTSTPSFLFHSFATLPLYLVALFH